MSAPGTAVELKLINMTADTCVDDYGQMVYGFELEFDRDITDLKLTPTNIALEGALRHPVLPDISAGVTGLNAIGETLCVSVDPFLYEKEWRLTVVKNGSVPVSVTSSDVSSVNIDIVDDFAECISDSGLRYRLYTPPADGPLPLVVWFHGSGERGTDNLKPLTHNRGAAAFAEPEYQRRHACIVLAPQSAGDWPDEELTATADIIRRLIRSGIANPSRIYAVGLAAFQATLRFSAMHRDLLAAAIPIIYWKAHDRDWSPLADLPMWTCIAEHDFTGEAPYLTEFAESMKAMGNSDIQCTIYTDAEMAEYGLFGGLLHWSWIPTINDMRKIDWLFSHSR